MTSLLRKKRRTTRPNMLLWMRDSWRLSVGLGCLWGISGLVHAAEPTAPKNRPVRVAGRSALDKPALDGMQPIIRPAVKITRTAPRIIRAQNPFEEPVIEASKDVIPPPEPKPAATPDGDALKKLRDRSAKARWDQLHQEWLRARKQREAAKNSQPAPPMPESVTEQPATEQPAGEQPVGEPPLVETPAAGAGQENPFEPGVAAPAPQVNAIESPTDSVGEGTRQRGIPSRPVNLQAQPKPREQLPTEEELNRMLNADNGQRLPPPVRDPSMLPKITEIQPNPEVIVETENTRPIPEQDPKSYVQLGNSEYSPRAFPEFTYAFEATNVWSNPLYFEDAPLERYGHALPPLIQPIASVARFGTQVVFLPYQMTIKPLGAKIYPLGYYSPGDCVPYRLYQPGWNTKAAAVQAATILGFRYALP